MGHKGEWGPRGKCPRNAGFCGITTRLVQRELEPGAPSYVGLLCVFLFVFECMCVWRQRQPSVVHEARKKKKSRSLLSDRRLCRDKSAITSCGKRMKLVFSVFPVSEQPHLISWSVRGTGTPLLCTGHALLVINRMLEFLLLTCSISRSITPSLHFCFARSMGAWSSV